MAKERFELGAPFLKRVYFREPPKDRAEYPLSLPILDGLDLTFSTPVTVIVGENGSGKSTLLETIAYHCGFNVSGGNRDHVYDQTADVAPLADALTFAWRPKVAQGFFMRAESFFNFAGYLDEMSSHAGSVAYASYGGSSLHRQSHGEAFLSLFENRFGGKGIYILDEPEAALSPQRQIQLLAILRALEESGEAQVIMATHSPILMAYPNADLYYLQGDTIRLADYRDTGHYRITRRFLENPDAYLREIFDRFDS
ncbi:AAA family ATPase [Pacificispira sp.]|uniref:AAA family ATPase n=1 Tax=Pacificispira sp. TaxID=2888761 RepID=UPI003BAA4C05